MHGGSGNDQLSAGSGAAQIFGGDDNDLILGSPAADLLDAATVMIRSTDSGQRYAHRRCRRRLSGRWRRQRFARRGTQDDQLVGGQRKRHRQRWRWQRRRRKGTRRKRLALRGAGNDCCWATTLISVTSVRSTIVTLHPAAEMTASPRRRKRKRLRRRGKCTVTRRCQRRLLQGNAATTTRRRHR